MMIIILNDSARHSLRPQTNDYIDFLLGWVYNTYTVSFYKYNMPVLPPQLLVLQNYFSTYM